MATEGQQLGGRIDPDAFKAAVTRLRIDQQLSSQLKAALNNITPGGENTLLHLAASVGNLHFIQQLLQLNRQLLKETDPEVKPLLVNATNAEKDTALHLAAQGGFSNVVKILLQQPESGVDLRNKLDETALFKAYESGNLETVKAIFDASPSSLLESTVHKRNCLSVAVNRGDSDLVDHILNLSDAKQLIQRKDELGNTALHIAVERNYVHIIKKLIKFEAKLCYWVNDSQETPICVAAKLGHLEAVQELINERPDAVEIRNSCGMNVLHLAALVRQVRIVDYLNEEVGLSYLVNKGLDKPPHEEPLRSGGKTDPAEKKDPKDEPVKSGGNTDAGEMKSPFSRISEGDTPLHIAAKKKDLNMVKSLLCIAGINKFAVNKAGLTAFDIVRENTHYHESDKIISVLASYPSNRKPFLYSAPKVSAEKHEVAVEMVDKTYEDRRNTELVVAVLLATMSFTAAFTAPGSFVTDDGNGNGDSKGSGISLAPAPGTGSDKSLGSPILLPLASFKVFLIFDCVAFFLSLLVVLMWQMSTPITTGNKVLFLCITNLLVCATFAFTAYGFMLAVYAMLSNMNPELAWFILGACLIICFCGNFTFFYMAAKFTVKKARFNHLNGLLPFLSDRLGEYVWIKLERWGLLDLVRRSKTKWLAILYYHSNENDK
ncbi:hypothetical protein SUGI_1428960 [Cryptomeria japonica]|uniref:PGG domain-containing protein n=1 Tax=Cryptomeria japonica TaxID=3369 RepID=A0AAD3RR04_CRYJA|nr:ankyrin repeat-containing protein At5g02620-like [Cryptomeria japonica]GLJ58285.1 hypothetical protein SUGI_1428960 [Cryptomeria japonica]